MSDNVWDLMEQEAREEGSQGGTIARTTIHRGYTFFAGGYSAGEYFASFADDASKVAAKKKVKASLPAGKRLQYCMAFELHKDGVKGREVNWQNDSRFLVYAPWMDSWGIVKDSLKRLGLVYDSTYWLRFDRTDDPGGRTDDNGKPKQVEYPIERYDDEAAATKAGIEQAALFADGNDAVEEVEAPAWLIREAKSASADGMSNEDIAAKFGQSVSLVEVALAAPDPV